MNAISKSPHWYQSRLRLIGWAAALALLSLPAVAMQAGAEGVDWSITDFLLFGTMLLVLGLGLEFAARRSGDMSYRAAAAIALFGNFFLFWANAAVGIIGPESSAPNLLFLLLPLIGAGAALATRGAPRAMAKAMVASAVVQGGIGLFALLMATASGTGSFRPVMIVTALFVLLWLASAALFSRAARA